MGFLISNLNVYRKVIVSILAMILLTFGVQGISYSQNVPMEADSSYTKINKELIRAVWRLTEPEGVREIYNQGIRSVMWITTDDGQASGVLINKELRMAVTNKHVAKNHESVNVFFPVRDANGIWIYDRSFYGNESNQGILTQLGYATTGRVIKKDSEHDLAIVRLDGIPETAREIDRDFIYDYREMKRDNLVHILGNPGGRSLWRWTLGNFQEVTHLQGFRGEFLHINADIYGGNSGGPVLNNGGRLIGIISLSDRLMNAYAIPLEYIDELMKKPMSEIQVFSITNHTALTVSYLIKWTENLEWKQYSLQQKKINIHWYPKPLTAIPEGYPQILFDHIVDNNEEVSPKHYKLETNTTTLGSGVKPSHNKDARKYQFKYYSETKEIKLQYLKD